MLVATADIPANTLGSEVRDQGLLTTELVAVGFAAGRAPSPRPPPSTTRSSRSRSARATSSSRPSSGSARLSNIQIPEGFDGVAVTIDYTNGGAGYIAPGDKVNIYGVYGEATGSDGGLGPNIADEPDPAPRTELALTNVLVLDVSAQQGTSVQSADATDQQTVGRQSLTTPLTYLLAVRTTDVERIVQLTSFADIYLSLTADDAPPRGRHARRFG